MEPFFVPGVHWRCKIGAGPCARIPQGAPLSHTGFVSAPRPQRWARVQCTLCTHFCYATARVPISLLQSDSTHRH